MISPDLDSAIAALLAPADHTGNVAPLVTYLLARARKECTCAPDEADSDTRGWRGYDLATDVIVRIKQAAAEISRMTAAQRRERVDEIYCDVVKERRDDKKDREQSGLCYSWMITADQPAWTAAPADPDAPPIMRGVNRNDEAPAAAPADLLAAEVSRAVGTFCRQRWPVEWRIEAALAAHLMHCISGTSRRWARALELSTYEERLARTTAALALTTASSSLTAEAQRLFVSIILSRLSK